MKADFKKKDPHFQREVEKYGQAIPSREFLLKHLEALQKPVSAGELIQFFELEDPALHQALKKRLMAMHRDGQLRLTGRGRYSLLSEDTLIQGVVVGQKNGFGYVQGKKDEESIILPPYQMRTVFPGDVVLVRPLSDSHRGSEGAIVRVLASNTQEMVGYFQQRDHMAFVVPLDRKIHQNIVIHPQHQGEAHDGDYVVVQILEQPSWHHRAVGRIDKILGAEHGLKLAIEATCFKYHLSTDWSEAVVRAAQSADNHHETLPRRDCRSLSFVTIDGEDSKDFDDAIFARRHANRGWTLFVAIADVSHYVRPGDPLDQEARHRGNSVYFPDYVVPMLPEELSNELCSLQPNVERLAMVCEMAITEEGVIEFFEFYPATILSKARLTYSQAATYFEGKEVPAIPELVQPLKDVFELYEVLLQVRIDRGALEFDTAETQVIFNDQGRVEKILPRVRNCAYRVIEECMLAANVCTAELLEKHHMPALFRIHEGPDLEKLETLREFLDHFGLRLRGGEKPTPQDYTAVLGQITHRPENRLIQTVLLRSLKQAVYSPENKGHFGLAYEAYTHFTSPIRRYPDLVVHRAIKHILSRTKSESEPWAELGEHCSQTERQADVATREVMDWLKCEFISHHLGEVFTGVITGVTGFGLFLELESVYVEGLLHVNELKDDYYEFDLVHHCLRGRRSGQVYRLGDRLLIQVARVDISERTVDFVLA